MKLFYYIWSLIERFGTNFVSLGGNIVLSYLLTPQDFGIVAMLGVFTSLIFVFVDCGLSDGLLMYEKPSNRDFNTVFYFNLGVGIAVFILYTIISPYVASFFGRPEMQQIMNVFGIGAIISGLTIAQMTKLRSHLKFKKIAAINLASVLSALVVAIIMAKVGLSYWALVALQVCYSLFTLIYLILFSKWNLRLEFDIKKFNMLWRFGVNLLFSTLVTQISRNIFAFVIGKYCAPVQAGYIGQAQKLQETPTNSLECAISITSYVLIAKNNNDLEKSRSFLHMFGVMTFINTMFCFLLLSLSQPIIEFVFPEKWLPVIPYFRMMLCLGLISPVCNFMMVIFKLFNRTYIIRNVLLIEKTCIIIFAFLMYPFGVFAIIGAAIVLSFISFLLYIYYASKVIEINKKDFIRIYFENIFLGAVISTVVYICTNIVSNSFVALVTGFCLFLCLMLVSCRIFKREYYEYMIGFMKRNICKACIGFK